MPENDRFLRALKGQPVDRTPVWLMRQAGRYLPEYRALRSKAGSFLNLCRNPALACEVTLQPLRRYPLDAAIIFADILLVPDAMGANLAFLPGEGPVFDNPIRTAETLSRLGAFQADQLSYVYEAIERVRAEITIPLIGFCGSPWTVATYMVEGGSSKDFRQIKRLAYAEPALLSALLEQLTQASGDYLIEQVKAGAQALMIFDTWGSVLPLPYYQRFSLAYMRQLVERLKLEAPEVPVILFTKGLNMGALGDIVETRCDGLGLDWSHSLAQVRQQVGDNITLQGNIDPASLYATPQEIEKTVQHTLQAYGSGHRHILNLGHGVHQDTNPDHVGVLVDAVAAHSPQYHQ